MAVWQGNAMEGNTFLPQLAVRSCLPLGLAAAAEGLPAFLMHCSGGCSFEWQTLVQDIMSYVVFKGQTV